MQTISGNFARRGKIVPDFIMNVPGLTLGSRVLYGTLCNSAGEKDHCWPSQKYLAKSINQSIRSVQNHLKELAKAGFIRVGKRPLRGNLYRLLMHPAVGCMEDRRHARAAAPSVTQSTRATSAVVSASAGLKGQRVHEKCAQGINIKERQEIPPFPPKHPAPRWEAEAAFQRVWEIWPIREARKSALRLWHRLWSSDERPQLETILGSIKENQARNPRWKRGFVPFLANWLKDRRWEDELPCNVTAAQGQGPTPAMESQVKAGRQGEEGGGNRISDHSHGSAQRDESVPDSILTTFDAAVSIWPINLTHGELLQARGLWKFLYKRRMLPSLQDITRAAQTTSQQFVWWLHGYKELQPT